MIDQREATILLDHGCTFERDMCRWPYLGLCCFSVLIDLKIDLETYPYTYSKETKSCSFFNRLLQSGSSRPDSLISGPKSNSLNSQSNRFEQPNARELCTVRS